MFNKGNKLPKNILQQDSTGEGRLKLKDCPNCVNGKIGNKACVACRGKGKRYQ